ncbi:MAG: PsbP-related protein [Candidatus Hadarchaeia archaeon]
MEREEKEKKDNIQKLEKTFHENLIPIAIVICAVAIALGLGLHFITNNSDLKTYESEEFGFSFSYPKDWRVAEGSDTSEFNIRDETAEGEPQVVGKVIVYEEEGLDAEQRILEMKDAIESEIDKRENYSFAEDLKFDLEGREIRYTILQEGEFEYQGEEFNKRYSIFYITLGEEKRGIAIEGQKYGIGPSGFTEDEYQKYKDPINQIIDSFELYGATG